MDKRLIRIEEFQAGERIDLVLAELFPDLSRSRIQKLMAEGKVMLAGAPVNAKSYRVKEEDEISLEIDEPVLLEARAEDLPLKIIYEDERLIVVDKEEGMVVHPGPGNSSGTLVNGLLYHCRGNLSSINGIIRPGIVHRLDKDTSGLLVAAKDDEVHRNLAAQFERRTVERIYRAVVHNSFQEDDGLINEPIGRDPNNRLKMKVDLKKGREAITLYRVLERFGRQTYVEAELKTGRTHQIRVHMAYIKHPILGDSIYGPKKDKDREDRLFLHAYKLGFIHPKTGRPMEFTSSLPYDFEKVLENLRKK